MPVIQHSQGFHIHYLDPNPVGTRGILLFHGLGANAESWQLQFPELLSGGYRPLAPDARGFGKSDYPGDTSIASIASDFAELADRLELPTAPHIVGISLGGVVALQFALDYPQLTGKLVLVNTFACLQPKTLTEAYYFLLRFLLVHTIGLEPQARTVARRIFPDSDHEQFRRMLVEQIMQSNPAAYRATMRALARFDVRSRLGELRAPTLVVTGAQDTTVHPATQEYLARQIVTASHVIIENAGHAVTIQQPERFNHLLIDFLT